MLSLYCQHCGEESALRVGDSGQLEVMPCQACGSHRLATDKRKRSYVLTVNDRRFLRSLRIKADDD